MDNTRKVQRKAGKGTVQSKAELSGVPVFQSELIDHTVCVYGKHYGE